MDLLEHSSLGPASHPPAVTRAEATIYWARSSQPTRVLEREQDALQAQPVRYRPRSGGGTLRPSRQVGLDQLSQTVINDRGHSRPSERAIEQRTRPPATIHQDRVRGS